MNAKNATPFWDRVQKTDSCWLWTGYKDKNGYGRLTVNQESKLAHRLSWELTYGNIPEGMCVLHKCDNPKCVNPVHLFIGTQLDNIKDCNTKKRASGGSLPGERNKAAKITSEDAIQIFTERNINRKRLIDISKNYGISLQAVHLIATGKKWSWLTKGLIDENPII